VILAMMIPHISRVFVPETAIVGDLDGLQLASMDEDSLLIGPPGRYSLMGYLIPINQLEQSGIPELVASPAAMILGLSTHERAVLFPQFDGMWQLLLQTGRGEPESYCFRDHPEPRPVATARRRRAPQFW
jgi:hypothetical protein